MVTGKMLIKKSHKNLINVSFHISTELGIEANNLSLLSFTLGWAWNICLWEQCCNQELLYRSGFYHKSSQKFDYNHWWNLINYWWRVVETFIYRQQFIICFFVDFRSKYTSKKFVPIKDCSNYILLLFLIPCFCRF